jgi:hypothetical protein
MSILDPSMAALSIVTEDPFFDEGQVAAAAFLARYSGRTLDAYRYDLRCFFQWASDAHLAVLEAKRPHIELYRTSMEERNLAPSTIDRRLSTVCGFYRFAHIDGRVPANPAQYVRRPKVHPSEGRGLDRQEFGTFLYTAERFDPDHAALAVLLGLNGLRVSEACGANIEDFAVDRGTGPSGLWARAVSRRSSPRAEGSPDSRPGHRGALRRPDSPSTGRSSPGSSHCPSLGPVHRQTGRTRRGLPPHAPSRLHHGRPRCWCPSPGCPDRCPSRRSEDHDDL